MTPGSDVNLSAMETERLSDGVRFTLPKRDLGKARWAGPVMMLIGFAICGFGYGFIAGPLDAMKEQDTVFRVFLLVFVIAGFIPVLMGLGLVTLGVAVLTGSSRASVEVRDGKLTVVERAAFLWWRRSRPIKSIEQIAFRASMADGIRPALREAMDEHQVTEVAPGLRDVAALVAKGEGIKEMVIAPGYPRELLEPLAAAIAGKVNARAPGRLFDRPEAKIAVVEEPPPEMTQPQPAEEPVIEPPAKSTITVDHNTDSDITFTAHPLGLWRGCKFQTIFSIIWIAFSSLMCVGMARDAWPKGGIDAVMAFVFPMVFIGFGVGLFIGALNIGRRIVIIDIVGDLLLITRGSMFGTKVEELPIGDLKSIRVGPSNIQVNNKTLPQLQIRTRDGKTHSLLTYRKEDDLAWLAQQLRLVTGVKAI